MLIIDGAVKKFKSVVIADNINLKLENYTYGLLGRNGSGKTTLLRCITKIEKLNGGSIYYENNGNKRKNYLNKIGYLPQNFDVFGELTVFETLQFFANLKECNISKNEIEKLLKSLNLISKKDTAVKNLSGGMKRRLFIAQALIGNPKILLLDEPTSGLDPEERLNFKNVIRQIKNDKCIVLSTHIITDIDSLCDKILVLSNGIITQFDSCKELSETAKNKVYAVESIKDINCPYYSMGTIGLDGRDYEKIICKNQLDAITLEPTVEDGYICFSENLY